MIRASWRCRRRGLLATALILTVACGGEGAEGEKPQRAASPPGAVRGRSGVVVHVTAAKRTYTAGEPIALMLGVRNPTDASITLRFPTGQRYDFVIESPAGVEVWRWSAGRMFAQVLGQQAVPTGWELNYNEMYGGRLAPGTYRVRGLLTTTDEPLEARTEVVVRP